ncbi:MAG: Glutamate-semialdehyde -aminomutase, partial [Actinomycetota bacterium]
DARAAEVGQIVSDALTAAGVAHHWQRAGNLFSVFFTGARVTNFDEAKAQDTDAFARFFHAMLENGVSLPPSAFEAWFVSAALTDADVEIIRAAATVAAQAAARA